MHFKLGRCTKNCVFPDVREYVEGVCCGDDTFFNCIFYFLHTLYYLSLSGKFGPPYLGKAKSITAAARAAVPNPASACWVFSCFRNPPNYDIDYRIFNERTRSFVCVRIHTRGWAHRQRVSTAFLTRKKSHFIYSLFVKQIVNIVERPKLINIIFLRCMYDV